MKIKTFREHDTSEAHALKKGETVIVHHDFGFKDGKMCIVEVGKEDREALIQSYADETGIYNILAKYAKTGDASVLMRTQGFYADISEYPTDDLDPNAAAKAAANSVSGLNAALGTSYTADDLANMTGEQLQAIIEAAVASKSESKESEAK